MVVGRINRVMTFQQYSLVSSICSHEETREKLFSLLEEHAREWPISSSCLQCSVRLFSTSFWNAQSFVVEGRARRLVVGRGWLPFRPRVAFHLLKRCFNKVRRSEWLVQALFVAPSTASSQRPIAQ